MAWLAPLPPKSWRNVASKTVSPGIGNLGISAVMLAFDGAFDRQTLMSLAIALPATMLAARPCLSCWQIFNCLILKALAMKSSLGQRLP